MDDEWIATFQKALLQMKAEQVEIHARICALEETFICAIALIKQSDAEKLESYLRERTKYWHDALLRTMEDINPSAAANLDRRQEQDLPEESA